MINKNLNFKKWFTRTPKTWVSGFTILESLVAILVLSLSISGVFSAVRQSLSQTIIAKDEVKAFYLAQEAIEIIRNHRDINRLATIEDGVITPWLANITNISACINGTCRVDATNPDNVYFYACGSNWGSCPKLRQDQSTFLYNYDSADPETNFRREIQIESINADEVAVTIRVSWSKGIINNEFKVKTILLNWL